MPQDGLAARLWSFAVWTVVGFFVLNLLAMIAAVVLDSVATRWLGTWLPASLTTCWYPTPGTSSRPDSQTLVVALDYAVFAAGVRAPQSIDAMAVVYMLTTLAWLLVALRFVNPTQIVARGKGRPA